MSIRLKIFFLIILSWSILYSARAQKTYTTVTITGNSFNDATDSWFGGGANVKVSYLSFFVEKQLVGTIYRADLTAPGSYALTRLVDITTKSPELMITVHYSHHEWNALGTTHYYPDLNKDIILTSVNLGRYSSETKFFNEFTELDESITVDWRFNYFISITPFQPTIDDGHEFCYQEEENIVLKTNNPDYYGDSDLSFQWQYGYYSTQWTANPEFNSFQYNIIGSLYSKCPGGEILCEKIENAILNTDYTFMNDYYDLYSAPNESNNYQIATLLQNGILSQQYYYLTEPEINFFTSNFLSVCLEQTSLPAPNLPSEVITSWIDITNNDLTGSIIFNPGNLHIPDIPEIVRVGLQVRTFGAGRYGPFSEIRNLIIRPKAPSFKVSSTLSCSNNSTGEISVSEITGVSVNFKTTILYSNFEEYGEPEFFSSPNYTLYQKLKPGEYNIAVYYADVEGCSKYAPVHIGTENDLNFTFDQKEATCPEKADAEIAVNITSSAHYSSFTLNGETINGTSGKFTGLDDGTYTFSASDFCTVKSQEITVGHRNEIIVSIPSSADPTCLSGPNGSIIAVASGSSSTYDYQLFNGSGLIRTETNAGTSVIFGALPGGTYTVKARSNLCVQFNTEVQKGLTPVQDIDFTYDTKDVKCFGESTGEISIVASGGKPAYHYQLESNPYTDLPEFSGLPAGTYQVKVHTNDLLCNDSKSKYITVNTAPKIQIGLDAVNTSCFESEDGSMTAIVSGGSGIYSCSWQEYISSSWYLKPETSFKLSGLYAGRYKANITDSWGCHMSAEGSVTEPPLLIVESALSRDVVCFGENGSISITASGGSGAYEYSCTENGGTVYRGSTSNIGLPAGDYYVRVKDAHGCEATFDDYRNITVTAPVSALNFSVSSPDHNGFNLLCNDDNSGELSLVATGGNGPSYNGYIYSVSGKPDNITGYFSGLAAGTYTMTVKDARGCIVTKSRNLNQPDPVSLNLISITPVKCFGASTGEIRVSASGGIAGTYKYRLDGIEMLTPGIFQNLPVKTYDVQVADDNGCRQNISATVQSLNPPIGITIIPEDVRCYGENNGRINTYVSGGTGGFKYSWEINRGSGWLPFGSASENLTDLVPAKYRIKAIDSESCNESKETEIIEPSRLVVSGATPKDVVCFGGKGSLSISASGGSPVYTYFSREKSGTVYDSPLAEIQLPGGVFSISVKDGKGCEAVYPGEITITSPSSSLDFTTTVSSYNGFSVSCTAKNDAFILAEASGGNGSGYSGYKYSINGSPDATENRFVNLAKGTYMVKVTDARGCKIERSINLNEPQPLTANILSSTPVKCYGESTGEFSVSASGGIQNTYKFSLNGNGEIPAGIFKSLPAGSYTVKVTDINGCSKSIQATVINKNPLIATGLSSTPVRCYGENNGTIASTVSGGAGGFNYSWEKKSPAGWQTIQNGNSSAESLSAGFYRLSLRDADNCPAKDSIAVIEPSSIEITKLGIRDAVCFGEKGSFDIEAKGGNGGYSFYVSGNEGTTYDLYKSGDILVPASYRIKVRDLKGCELVDPDERSISAPNHPLDFNYELSAFGAYNISCHGNNDGSISLVPSGGNDNEYNSYEFRLNDTDFIAGNFIKDLEAGSYEVSVTDGRGCMVSKTISLSEPPSIMKLKVVSLEQPKCVYDKNGSISLFAEGGKMPYEYSMNGSLYGSSPVFSNLGKAEYNFKVRDSYGCSETIDTSLVNIISEMKIQGIIYDAKCYGENSGSVDVQVSDGANPYTFRWKDNSVVSSSRSSLRSGEYTVTITDAAGCVSEKRFFVNEPEHPLSISAVSSPACAELKNGIIKASAGGGTPPYLFALDRRSGYGSASQFDVFPGNHNVYVSDMNGCLSESAVTVKVRNVKPDINFMLATNRYELDTLVIIDVSVPVPDKVNWEFPDETMIIDTTSHKALIKYKQSGLYPVKMTGTFGTCIYAIDKLLNISPFDPLVSNEDRSHSGIKSLVISPNPNDGRFVADLELYSKQKIAVKVFDFYSRVLFSETWPADIVFRKEIKLPENTLPGNYVLWIIGENDSRPLIFVISK